MCLPFKPFTIFSGMGYKRMFINNHLLTYINLLKCVFTMKNHIFLDHHITVGFHVASPLGRVCVLSQAALAKAQRGDVYDENREAIVGLSLGLRGRSSPMTDPWCWYINANMTGFFVDGIHGTPYIAAPWIRHGSWKYGAFESENDGFLPWKIPWMVFPWDFPMVLLSWFAGIFPVHHGPPMVLRPGVFPGPSWSIMVLNPQIVPDLEPMLVNNICSTCSLVIRYGIFLFDKNILREHLLYCICWKCCWKQIEFCT